MPVDSHIALAGKPPVIEPVDFAKTFLTLGQLKYLGAQAQKVQAEAALAQTHGAEALATLAGRQRVRAVSGGAPAGLPLTSLRTPQPGGPPFDAATLGALPQGGSTGAMPETPEPSAPAAPPAAGSPPGTPAAAPASAARPDPYQRAMAFLEADPFEGAAPAAKILELAGKDLERQKEALALDASMMAFASNVYAGVTDQASLERGNGLIAHVTGRDISHLPTVYSPAAMTQIAELQRSAQQRIDQRNKEVEQAIAQHKAQSEAVLAEAARTSSHHKLPQQTSTGGATFDPVTGAWTLATTPTPSGGQTPITTLAQAERAKELNSGWMNSQQNQLFLQTKQAVTDLQAAAKLETGPGDMAVVSNYNRVIAPGTSGAPGKIEDVAQLGTLSQQAQRELQRLFTSGTLLSPTVRQEIVSVTLKTYANRVAQHQQIRGYMLDMAKDLGVRNPETVIPDLSTATPAPSGARTVTRAQVQALATKHQKSVQEMEAIIRQAGDTIVP
jgi:hypothetical protein